MLVKEKQMAPTFTLMGSEGEKVSLEDFKGQHVVLYFYPKDMTPGCTTEACDFRDEMEQFRGKETVVLGISSDSLDSHKKFVNKYNLNFLLLSDDEATISKKYGAWEKDTNSITRSTVIIDREGIIKKVYPSVKVNGHVKEVLSYI